MLSVMTPSKVAETAGCGVGFQGLRQCVRNAAQKCGLETLTGLDPIFPLG